MADASPGGVGFDTTLPASTGVAAVGVAAAAARRDHVHPSAVTYAGGNTTEATTTSTTAVDLITVSALTIAAATPIHIVTVGRKTSGAAAGAGLGIKLNTTVVSEADTVAALLILTGNDQAETGGVCAVIPPRVTSYLRTGCAFYNLYTTASIDSGTQPACGDNNDAPTASITDFVIRGISGNALVTLGSDELNVYTLATS